MKTIEIIRQQFMDRIVDNAPSPAGNWLQFRVARAEEGDVTLSLEIRKEMTNPYGKLHGGMMSLLIDESIGWGVVSLGLDRHFTSLNLQVNFLYGAGEGETIYSNARVLRAGKKIAHVECTITNEAATLLAKASSQLVVTELALTAADSRNTRAESIPEYNV